MDVRVVAVRALESIFIEPGASPGADEFLDPIVDTVALAGMDVVIPEAGGWIDFVDRMPEDAFKAVPPANFVRYQVRIPHGLICRTDDVQQALVALRQELLRPPALGDVASHANQSL